VTNDPSPSRWGRLARRGAPVIALLSLALAVPLAAAAAAAPSSTPSATYAVPLAPGAAKPTPGSGIATKAAMDNPKCRVGDTYGPYGQFDSSLVGGGPVCTAPFKTGQSNGGATAPGVTKDSIKVVVTISNPPETRSNPAMNLATGTAGTDQDAFHDLLFAERPWYETWGRNIDVSYYTVDGTDEASQHAAAVAIKAMKPFAVVNTYNAGYGIMAADLAKAKILVYDAETGKEDFTALAPYLWGSTDSQVAAINTAEVLGKQLVGGKAIYGGDDVKNLPRKFGLVTKTGDVDVPGFKSALAKYKGTITSEADYPPTGGTYGDATLAGQYAPTIVSKMKADGVTTMVLFTDAAMNKAMMEQASAQDWHPEWFHTGNSYADYQTFAATMPVDQSVHFFGISGSSPYATPVDDGKTATAGPLGSVLDWFWGLKNYSSSARLGNGAQWLLQGIHAAGPDLTVKNFQQGQFSIPPVGGGASGIPQGAQTGYGRTTGLPYDQYNRAPADYLLMWMSNTAGVNATGSVATPTSYFVQDPKNGQLLRYKAGSWPTQKVTWFDPAKSVASFTTRPTTWPPAPVRTVCQGCPATGATTPTSGSPGTTYTIPIPTTKPSTTS